MKIKKATSKDISRLYYITRSCAEAMIKNGIFQWDDQYPSLAILENDIALKQIWKLEIGEIIIGIIVLTEIEDIEYENVKWLTENKNNLYVHRLAVNPKFQGKGYAQKLMDFAENYAKKKKYKSIRLDTFSKNKRNQQFYEKRNYTKLESIYFPNQSEHPFYCYEMIINA
jgi:ribosomal protein S18 acetylase RimI-like enzyme